MHLNYRKSDRTHLSTPFNSKLVLIPNLKSDFQKKLKNPQKIAKTKEHDFCSVYFDRNFVPNQMKMFFSNSAPSNYPDKIVFK